MERQEVGQAANVSVVITQRSIARNRRVVCVCVSATLSRYTSRATPCTPEQLQLCCSASDLLEHVRCHLILDKVKKHVWITSIHIKFNM